MKAKKAAASLQPWLRKPANPLTTMKKMKTSLKFLRMLLPRKPLNR